MIKRESWLDALRIAAAFLVIVNHTNSGVFQQSSPSEVTWWLSVAWYYISKLAVPVFVMVSGACLLNRQDTLRKALGRFMRVLAALLIFSYAYYLHDAWVYWGLWPRMADLGTFFGKVWKQQITDGFWYLYFYLGLMLMLPFLQRMAAALKDREMLCLIGLCVLLGAVWPLAAHYAPALELPVHFGVPLFTGYLGLFFAGSWIRRGYEPKAAHRPVLLAVLLASLAASILLTRLEFSRVAPGQKYWFMDERTQPSVFTILGAAASMMLAKGCIGERRLWTRLGECAFGIYLVQDWIIAQSETRLYEPLCGLMGSFPAVLVWEATVFAAALAAAWVMKRIPGLKKIV